MSYIEYKPRKRPANDETQIMIGRSVDILNEYAEQGFELTLRQLYYRFVTRHKDFPNTDKSYNKLKNCISRAREAGEVSWAHIVDRARPLFQVPVWETADDWLEEVKDGFALDPWVGQPVKIRVFVEKDALSDVVAKGCNTWRCEYLPNKGYLSASAAWRQARSMLRDDCNDWVVLHLGDHDPSGIDMTRDIRERLDLFSSRTVQDKKDGFGSTRIRVKRIALNMDQITERDLVPDPAKPSDSRYESYCKEYNTESSWELDAVEPNDLVDLIKESIRDILGREGDPELYDEILNRERIIKEKIDRIELES